MKLHFLVCVCWGGVGGGGGGGGIVQRIGPILAIAMCLHCHVHMAIRLFKYIVNITTLVVNLSVAM